MTRENFSENFQLFPYLGQYLLIIFQIIYKFFLNILPRIFKRLILIIVFSKGFTKILEFIEIFCKLSRGFKK